MKLLISLVILTVMTNLAMGCATTSAGQNTTWDVSGVVDRFITTAEGEVDGFILTDGMQIRFPAHMSKAITDSVAVGDTVNIKGEESSTNAMWAEHIITPKNAKEITIAARAKGKLLAPRKEREKAYRNLTNLTVSGEIDTILHDPSGEISGFVLTEGSVVRLPADIRTPARAYDIGQYVEVTGYGSDNKFGKSVEASSVQRQSSEYEIDYE